MPKKFLTSIDLGKNELQNARIQNLASAPSSPVAGQVYYDTVSNKFGTFNGSTWDYMGTGAGAGDASTNTSSSVDGEIALFSGTAGKTIKRATTSGILKATSGVIGAATAGTDYLAPTGSGTGLTGVELTSNKATSTSLGTSDTLYPSQNAVKVYVDNAVQGLSWKTAVRAIATSNITLSGAQTIDGVSVIAGDRVIVAGQSTASQNGIYVASASTWTRATDADSGTELVNATAYVSEGSTFADTVWTVTTNAAITVGTTSIAFAQVNGGTVAAATTSTAGKVQLATSGEAEAKSDTAKAVTPAALVNFPIKKTFTIGDGSTTAIAVTHSLGSKDVITQIRQASDDAVVEADIVNTSTTVTMITFATAPASNAIKVVIIG